MKTAVILFNLGGPDGKESIPPFLFNFFMDKNIIRAPLPVRFLLAKLIAFRRSRNEAGSSYGYLGYKSPLLGNTQAQADALQMRLGQDYKVFISMRYWHPMADDVARQVKAWGAERLILLPLYPQFSTTTTRSSFESWDAAAQKHKLNVPTRKICCYPWENGFVTASAQNIRAKFDAMAVNGQTPRLLFSAHGLPEKIIDDGDPYQWQCEQAAEKIVEKLGIENLDWQICYQSRVGPLKWIGPSTEEALHKAASDKVPVLLYPHAFVSEHVETLVELDIEYKELAEELGIPAYERAETVMADPHFIDGMAALVEKAAATERPFSSHEGARLCPKQFGRCPIVS